MVPRFWNETWCGVRPFKDLFPRIYALEENKSCTVSQRLIIDDWSSVLRRLPRGGAESYIDEHNLLGSSMSTRWSRFIPIKVNVLVWRLCLDKLPTLMNLDKKGIDVPSLLCPVCSDQVETADHLFFSCGMAQDLWGLLARWCQLDFPVISNIAEWFSWLDSAYLSKYTRSSLEGIASTMLWSIWNFRNAWIFSNSKPKKANIWDSVVHQSFLWISSRNPKCRFRWIDWLRNPIETHM
ncbi:RNA-directed DNA polymerase, eukaryota, reverse transcriptase zinc-binding domain protein [Tanacetum coccineum]